MKIKDKKRPSLYLQAKWKKANGKMGSKMLTLYDITAPELFRMIDQLARKEEAKSEQAEQENL